MQRRLPCSARQNSCNSCIMGQVSHQRSLLKRDNGAANFLLELDWKTQIRSPGLHCRFCSGSYDRFDGLSSDDDVQVLYFGIVVTKVTLTFISIHFMFGIKVDVFCHKITLLCSFVVAVVVVCLFCLLFAMNI